LEAEAIRSEARSPEDLGAWDLVARALSHFWKLTEVESKIAITILRQATHDHPNYAPAHSMLAFSLLVSTHVGWIPSAEEREPAARFARRAMELDESDPWAYMALGYLAFTGRKTDEAVRQFKAALDLNPNFAAAHGYIGWALAFNGQSDEALQHFDQSMKMSPRDPLNSFFFGGMSAAHYMAGRYPEAVKYGRQSAELRPGLISTHRILCASLAQAGQIEEAKEVMTTLRQLHPAMTIAWIKDSVPYTTEPMAKFLEGLRKAGLE
jgi:tetratricopeptide (TPR) repeat protein